jgi:hypothetical protein
VISHQPSTMPISRIVPTNMTSIINTDAATAPAEIAMVVIVLNFSLLRYLFAMANL